MKNLVIIVLLFPLLTLAQVGVNTITPKAALDVESSNNGILIPRVQLTSILDNTTIVNPNLGPLETSTLVYNIAASGIFPNNVLAGFYYWNGSQWIAITNNSEWKLEGNTAINSPLNPVTYGTSTIGATENFIGTKDNNDVVIGTNNIERLRVKNTTGNVGIGTANPTKKLDIVAPNNEIGLQILSGNNSQLAYLSLGRTVEYAQVGACTTASFFLDAIAGDMALKNFGRGKILLGASVNTNAAMSIIPGGNIGIGTVTPIAKLDITSTNRNDGINLNLTKNLSSGTSYSFDNSMTINSNDDAYGFRNSFLGTGSGIKIGALNTASAGILGSKIGFENNLQASGNSYLHGFKNTLTNTGSNLTLGFYNQIINPLGSTGITHSIENRITNNSTQETTGVFTEINSPDGGTGDSFGIQNFIRGSKNGNKVGVLNEITTDIFGFLVGVNSRIISNPSVVSNNWGTFNEIFVNTSSVGIGTINNLYGNTNGSLTGNNNYISNDTNVTDPNFIMVGTKEVLRGSSNAAKYGTLTTIDDTAGGTHYGIHATVLKPGANNFAGYFLGNVGIGTTTTNSYTFPPSRGTNGQVIQTDGTGNLSWQNPSAFGWSLTGNAVTGSDFIGSTNNANVRFRRSNLNAGFIGEFNVSLGVNAANALTSGTQNVAIGNNALDSNILSGGNTAVGYDALQSTTGDFNTAYGNSALFSFVTGNSNCAFGYNALNNQTSGINNIGIGTGSNVPFATGSNQIRMGNTAIGYAGIQVAWSVTSDIRWKSNIQKTNLGLNFINKLNPVSYFRKNDESKKLEYGFIAQELEKTLNESGATDNGIITKDDQGMLSVRYNDLIAPMVKAIQELKIENDALKQQNDAFEKRVKALETKQN